MSYSLTNPEPYSPNPWPKRIGITVAVLLVAGAAAFWLLRFRQERLLVESFMDALVAGDYQRAYHIWKPAPAYSYQSFLDDWGQSSPLGRIRSYQIIEVRLGGARTLLVPVEGDKPRTVRVRGGDAGVIVRLRINGSQEVRLWVNRADKSLSFPPF
ncbi:MAG: hypothetical protein ACE5HB_02395 [Terriglobia bacterium]